ncbi:MAG: DUF6580 family putative transport protein [Chlamydiales bacterium]
MNYSRLLAVFGLVFFAVMSRLLPHPPNFTAINAVAVFSAFTLGHFGFSCGVVYGAMLISDLIFGLHSQLLFVYFSLGLILFISRFRMNPAVSLLLSPLIFFFVTNFGVWLIDGFYPQTLNGLGLCYLAALPFLANELIGSFFYGFVLFSGFALFEKYIPSIQKEPLESI